MVFPEKGELITASGESSFMLSIGELQLEILRSCPENPRPIIAVICHPHPLFGGTMHNKVVYTLARTFKQLGLCSIRFNFRGVGKSTGDYAKGVGETEDLLALLEWIKRQARDVKIWLAGFSFGAYVAARAAQSWPVDVLITVAPPVVNFEFTSLKLQEKAWILVQGDADEIVDPDAVFTWAEGLDHPPQIIRMPGASHFFHGQLIELRELLAASLLPYLD